MPASIVTFADLGKKKNLKTMDILPVIHTFIDNNAIDAIVCRINRSFPFSNTRSAISLVMHYVLATVGRLIGKPSVARRIEEQLFDSHAAALIPTSTVVFFHPEYFFRKALRAAQRNGSITVGIATMAHLVTNAALEKEEFELLGIETHRKHLLYQRLLEQNPSLNEFDHIIALSDFVKNSYVASGFPEHNISVALTDISTEAFIALPRNEDQTFRVLFVSQGGVLKGLHYLLDAWKMLSLPESELVIVGTFAGMPEALRKRYMDAIASDSSIRQVQTVPHALMGSYYSSASVFAFPSLTEGNSRAVMEAMASGLPVITTDAARSMVEDGTSGYIVPIRSANALAEKLRYLYNNRVVAEQLGMRARDTIRTKKPFGESVFEIYQTIMKEHQL